MRQTNNYGLNIIDNTDKILDSIAALNENTEKIDEELISKLDTAHNTSESAHNDIRLIIADVEAIARGKSRAWVFDTVADLDTWLAVPANVSELLSGDNFYIRDLEVPDYWWDGTQKQELEGEKVDLTDYYNKTESDAKYVQKELNKGLSTNDYSTDEKNKLGNIAAGAQVNVIENIKINGVTQTPTLKVVDISIPTQASDIEAMPESTVVTAFWTGTQAQYDAIVTKLPTTMYLIHI
jgi:hypothetical protein